MGDLVVVAEVRAFVVVDVVGGRVDVVVVIVVAAGDVLVLVMLELSPVTFEELVLPLLTDVVLTLLLPEFVDLIAVVDGAEVGLLDTNLIL